MKSLLPLFLFSFLLLEFSGCGYKPSSKYSRVVVGEKISTNVVISAQDPENTVLIKDAVDKAIIEVFRASLVEKRYADTDLSFSISEPRYTPIQYNADGFVIAYRATITMHITRETKDVKKNYNAVGTYDFAIAPNAVITDQERFDAIKYSTQKAIAAFIAQVSAEGSRQP
ncbi:MULTISPECIES: LPS assembly lipoprotein LptE [Sulfurimonas]|uniref:LPS assembly lipoprotein LptE n=1 Tax=Sulfurimonas TaxID=202746 RepID=UPI0012644E82|nr:LPS assembly lipoprotein LptE [Sulfurimonas indica]